MQIVLAAFIECRFTQSVPFSFYCPLCWCYTKAESWSETRI